MKQFIIISLSAAFALIGIVAAFMPIPGGVLIAVCGVSTLIYNSPKTQHAVCHLRSRSPKVNRLFNYFENISEKRFPKMAATLEKTRP